MTGDKEVNTELVVDTNSKRRFVAKDADGFRIILCLTALNFFFSIHFQHPTLKNKLISRMHPKINPAA